MPNVGRLHLRYQQDYNSSAEALVIAIVIGMELSNMYSYVLVIQFVWMTWLASSSIATIGLDVQSRLPKLYDGVRKWRQSYSLIHDVIDEIDSFFGPALLLFFTRMFILFVIVVFETILYFDDTTLILLLPRVGFLVEVVLYNSILTFRVQQIKQQVISSDSSSSNNT